MKFNRIKALFHLVRIPNLIIIGTTLSLFYYSIEENILDNISFWILCIGTIGIAAAGNVINDIVDVEIDLINKEERVVVGRIISVSFAWKLYLFLNGLALCLAIYLRSIDLLIFFIVAILLLYFYSTLWKRQVFIGNLVVAFLCAWVVIEFEWLSYVSLSFYWKGILTAYAIFAFLSTLIRELVKDIEDMEGDKAQGCQTLAIQKGVPFSKKLIFFLFALLFLLLLLEASFFYYNKIYTAFYYTVLVLVFPLFYFMFLIHSAETSTAFGRISRWIKGYMLLGLLLLVVITCSQNMNQSPCSVALQEARMNVELMSLEIPIDKRQFYEGWQDAKRLDEFIFLIKGSPGYVKPCAYCAVINNGGKLNFIESNPNYQHIPFLENLLSDKSLSYLWGYNKSICKKFDVPYPPNRCGDSRYMNSAVVEELLEERIHAKWDSSEVFVQIDSVSFPLKLDSLTVNVFLNDKIYEFPFSLLYEGKNFSDVESSMGIRVFMNKYSNPFYCHTYRQEQDIVTLYVRDTSSNSLRN